jgi:hypothetical protein
MECAWVNQRNQRKEMEWSLDDNLATLYGVLTMPANQGKDLKALNLSPCCATEDFDPDWLRKMFLGSE